MTKLALRVKRRFSRQRGRNRAPRSKSFKTKELATAWAKANGVASSIETRGKKFVVAEKAAAKDTSHQIKEAPVAKEPVAKPVEKKEEAPKEEAPAKEEQPAAEATPESSSEEAAEEKA